jgi:FxLD family lantipeptide
MTTPTAVIEPTMTEAVDDDEFRLDMRVIEAVTPLVTMMCDTSDGCGSTCENSACATGSNDPF